MIEFSMAPKPKPDLLKIAENKCPRCGDSIWEDFTSRNVIYPEQPRKIRCSNKDCRLIQTEIKGKWEPDFDSGNLNYIQKQSKILNKIRQLLDEFWVKWNRQPEEIQLGSKAWIGLVKEFEPKEESPSEMIFIKRLGENNDYGKKCHPQLFGVKIVVSDAMKDDEIMLVAPSTDYMRKFFRNNPIPDMILS